jgi:Cu(I)/Ag(I) efflux system protein CusF
MKTYLAVVAVAALSMVATPASRAQSDGMAGMDVEKKSQTQIHKASGTVTKVDRIGSKVTIAHGAIQTLKWPAMTMSFVVNDKALLGTLSSGKKVEFEFVQQGRDYVIVSAR